MCMRALGEKNQETNNNNKRRETVPPCPHHDVPVDRAVAALLAVDPRRPGGPVPLALVLGDPVPHQAQRPDAGKVAEAAGHDPDAGSLKTL